MATPAQTLANRLNAQKSTGPRSVEGKAAVRFNAVRHGIDARSLVIPGESAAELETLARQYEEQYQPADVVEAHLVDILVRADWSQRRFARVETQLLALFLKDPELSAGNALGAVYARDAANHHSLHRLFRCQQAAQRDWFRAAKELRRLRQEREAAEPLVEQPLPVDPLPAAPQAPGADWLRFPTGGEAPRSPQPDAVVTLGHSPRPQHSSSLSGG